MSESADDLISMGADKKDIVTSVSVAASRVSGDLMPDQDEAFYDGNNFKVKVVKKSTDGMKNGFKTQVGKTKVDFGNDDIMEKYGTLVMKMMTFDEV